MQPRSYFCSRLHSGRRSIFTDGDKGLEAAVRACLPNAYHATCAFHRAQKFSDQTRTMPLFLRMAKAYTLADHILAQAELENVATDVSFATLSLVPVNRFCLAHMPLDADEAAQHWAQCPSETCEFSARHYGHPAEEFDLRIILGHIPGGHFPAPFGRTTSQGAESFAAKMAGEKGCSAFLLATKIFSVLLKGYANLQAKYEKRHQDGMALSASAVEYMQKRQIDLVSVEFEWAQDKDGNAAAPVPPAQFVSGDELIGSVRSRHTQGLIHSVTLFPAEYRSICSCRTPSIRGLPCVHALKVAVVLRIAPNVHERLVHRSFTTAAGRLAFQSPMQLGAVAVATSDLEPAKEPLLPPVNAPKRGRPALKRKRGKNESTASSQSSKPRGSQRATYRCSRCGTKGHTARSCKESH